MFSLLAIGVALFFAMNIGASGAAATMGIAYGSRAIKRRRLALLLSGVGLFLGAVIGGKEVIKTIGSGLIPSSLMTNELAVIILIAATITLYSANVLGIPLSTSEVTVGSIVGAGFAYHAVYFGNLLMIVCWWIIIPFFAFIFAFMFGKGILYLERHVPTLREKRWHKFLFIGVVVTGFVEAFSAGMNNVANAVGPLVGAGIISIQEGMLLGGLFVALGAIFLGGKVIETNGKKITNLSLLQGMTISGMSGLLVIIASIFGIPIPLTQITTSGILGMGTAKIGAHLFQQNVIKKILTVWLVSPVCSLVVSYALVKFFLENDTYTVFAIVSVLMATLGTITLIKITKNESKEDVQ